MVGRASVDLPRSVFVLGAEGSLQSRAEISVGADEKAGRRTAREGEFPVRIDVGEQDKWYTRPMGIVILRLSGLFLRL
jgi:hypothetical protein